MEEDEEPTWIDRHSVNCIICDDLFDEREAIGRGEDGAGDVCPKHKNPCLEIPLSPHERERADLTEDPNAL